MGFQESSSADEEVAASGSGATAGTQPVGGFSSYPASQQQAGFNGGFPASKPPTFPPPQPPASMAAGATTPAQKLESKAAPSSPAVAGRAAAPAAGSNGQQSQQGMNAQPPFLRQHLQQKPPPSQAPLVAPVQPVLPQGLLPPFAPPLLSPLGQASQQPGTMTEEERRKEEMLYLTTPEAERAAREKYGLLGILKVIRMTDPDLNTLALGMDLTTLGLNLNSPECLYATFASPWSDTPARKDPEFYLPQCYYMNPPQLKTAHLGRFSLETLFYIFYNMPRDTLQAYAAAELYNRGWKYQQELKTWFVMQEEPGQASRWVCFDPATWEKQYYFKPVDAASFLTEDDVRVKVPPSGSMPSTPTA